MWSYEGGQRDEEGEHRGPEAVFLGGWESAKGYMGDGEMGQEDSGMGGGEVVRGRVRERVGGWGDKRRGGKSGVGGKE